MSKTIRTTRSVYLDEIELTKRNRKQSALSRNYRQSLIALELSESLIELRNATQSLNNSLTTNSEAN
jgi:hypothetical protein